MVDIFVVENMKRRNREGIPRCGCCCYHDGQGYICHVIDTGRSGTSLNSFRRQKLVENRSSEWFILP